MAHEVCEAATILLVEDDEEDRWATQRAFGKSRLRQNSFFAVEDGKEAMDFLCNRGRYADAPRPQLILLDLNLPVVDGREVLRQIKRDTQLRQIPVVILTTSKLEEDILRSYDLGVNSYITKPVDFEVFLDVVQEIGTYWLEFVVLPPKK